MIVLNDNDLEIGIYPGRCIKAKNYKRRTERSIKWSEVYCWLICALFLHSIQ
jgi:hypothetical protein